MKSTLDPAIFSMICFILVNKIIEWIISIKITLDLIGVFCWENIYGTLGLSD